VIAADQASKLLAARRLAPGGRRLAAGVGLRPGLNGRPGVLRLPPAVAALLLAATVACLVAVLAPLGTAEAAGVGLLGGGAASNLADRVARGGVLDLVACGWWPVFNLADAALVAGAALVVAGAL
jgi:signal peptidase II